MSPVTPQGAGIPAAAAVTGTEFHLPKTKEDYDRILNNARKKALEDSGLHALVGEDGRSTIDVETIREAVSLAQQIHQDPRAFVQTLMQEMGEGEEEEELVDPDPDYTSPDGKAKFYSDGTVKTLLANLEQKILRQMKPALGLVDQAKQAAQMREIATNATRTANEVMASVKKLPHFEQLKTSMAKKLAALDPAVRRRIGSPAALYMAYNAALAEEGPNLERSIETRLRTEFGRQANAGQGNVVPGETPQVRKPVKDGDVNGLAKRMEELSTQFTT